MATKTKKARAGGKFGARYGKRVKDKYSDLESKQRKRQTCPFCAKVGIKRKANGIWHCPRCEKTFAHNTFYIA